MFSPSLKGVGKATPVGLKGLGRAKAKDKLTHYLPNYYGQASFIL
jgi:hypothetical protein